MCSKESLDAQISSAPGMRDSPAGAVMLPALSRGDFDRVVDFSVTLKTLAAVAEGKAPLPTGKMLLLSGTVSDVNILNKDERAFKVRIELITGEWIGLEDVKAYACYVEFSGPEFFKVFPARPPRTASPGRDQPQLAGRPGLQPAGHREYPPGGEARARRGRLYQVHRIACPRSPGPLIPFSRTSRRGR